MGLNVLTPAYTINGFTCEEYGTYFTNHIQDSQKICSHEKSFVTKQPIPFAIISGKFIAQQLTVSNAEVKS
jgi:hypothetical protein